MDDKHFDAWTRALASGGNRRQLLKGLFGLGGAAAVGGMLADPSDAARRPTPTPRPPSCPGRQTLQNGQCTCPANTTGCGSDCCPAGAQCCGGACCSGPCYAGGFCCPSSQDWCAPTGECCPVGTECCGASGCQPSCCMPFCDGSTCGSDGCGGVCTCSDDKICSGGSCICPAATMLCSDGICRACCEYSNQSTECASTQGGDASCWACSGVNGPGTPPGACGTWSAGCPLTGGGGTGYCGSTDHICYPYKDNGESCSINRECSSGKCSGGICTAQ